MSLQSNTEGEGFLKVTGVSESCIIYYNLMRWDAKSPISRLSHMAAHVSSKLELFCDTIHEWRLNMGWEKVKIPPKMIQKFRLHSLRWKENTHNPPFSDPLFIFAQPLSWIVAERDGSLQLVVTHTMAPIGLFQVVFGTSCSCGVLTICYD